MVGKFYKLLYQNMENTLEIQVCHSLMILLLESKKKYKEQFIYPEYMNIFQLLTSF
jgi:hypothetical protein